MMYRSLVRILAILAMTLSLGACSRADIVDAGGCVSDRVVAYDAVATGPADLVLTAKMTSSGHPVPGQLIAFDLLAKRDSPSVASTAGYTNKDGIASAHLNDQDIRVAYFRRETLTAHLSEAKYQKSILAATAKHPYCDAAGSASLRFR